MTINVRVLYLDGLNISVYQVYLNTMADQIPLQIITINPTYSERCPVDPIRILNAIPSRVFSKQFLCDRL